MSTWGQEGWLVQLLLTAPIQQRLPGGLRQLHVLQVAQCFLVQSKDPLPAMPQHIQDTQPILFGQGLIHGIHRVTQHMAVLALPIDPRLRVVGMLLGTAAQPGFVDFILLGMKAFLLFDQQVGQFTF